MRFVNRGALLVTLGPPEPGVGEAWGALPVSFAPTERTEAVAGVFAAPRGVGKAQSLGWSAGPEGRRQGPRASPRGWDGAASLRPAAPGAHGAPAPARGRGEQHSFLISARGQAARPRSRRSRLAGDPGARGPGAEAGARPRESW